MSRMPEDDYQEARLQERRDRETPGTPEWHLDRMDAALLAEDERQCRIHDARMSRGETDPNGELGYTPGLRRC